MENSIWISNLRIALPSGVSNWQLYIRLMG